MMIKDSNPAYVWFTAWRKQVRRMHTNPEERDTLCRAAVIAQAAFVMYQALNHA